MNEAHRISIRPYPDISSQDARDARARAWTFVFQCWQEKQRATRPGGPNDAKGRSTHDFRADKTILPPQ